MPTKTPGRIRPLRRRGRRRPRARSPFPLNKIEDDDESENEDETRAAARSEWGQAEEYVGLKGKTNRPGVERSTAPSTGFAVRQRSKARLRRCPSRTHFTPNPSSNEENVKPITLPTVHEKRMLFRPTSGVSGGGPLASNTQTRRESRVCCTPRVGRPPAPHSGTSKSASPMTAGQILPTIMSSPRTA